MSGSSQVPRALCQRPCAADFVPATPTPFAAFGQTSMRAAREIAPRGAGSCSCNRALINLVRTLRYAARPGLRCQPSARDRPE